MTPKHTVFQRLAGALTSARQDSAWQPEGQVYPRLLTFDARILSGRSGLYAVWHLGVRPQWLRVGFTTDLATAITVLARTPEITAFVPHDGPFVSWCFGTVADAAGRVKFLVANLLPAAQDFTLSCDVVLDPSAAPVTCPFPPGAGDMPPTPRG